MGYRYKLKELRMSEACILEALAEAHEAAAAVLRRRADRLKANVVRGNATPGTAVDRAKLQHPMLGYRQEQVLAELEANEPDGTTTGNISRALAYDQANVHITLQGLMERGFVERDTSRYPHNYRLGASLRDAG
jgi:hypothetical protein